MFVVLSSVSDKIEKMYIINVPVWSSHHDFETDYWTKIKEKKYFYMDINNNISWKLSMQHLKY